MTAQHPDDPIRAFLAEGRDELPDWAFDAVRSEIHRTRQRVVIGPWREPDVTILMRLGLATAAVVAIALVATQLLPTASGPGGQVASPTPPASPTPGATSAPLPVFLTFGSLSPGTYLYDESAGTFLSDPATWFRFTVPAGWTVDPEVSLRKNGGEPAEVSFTAWDVTHVFADACHWNPDEMPAAGATAAELAALLTEQASRVASATTDVTVGGLPAKRIEFATDPAVDTATCTQGILRVWPAAGPNLTSGECCFPKESIDQLSIVDIGDRHVVLLARHQPSSSPADIAELMSMVDSIEFVPAGSRSPAP